LDEEYLTKLADLTGMRFCRAGDYGIEGMREAVVGVRQGYIVAIGEETGSRKQSICLFIRFSPTSEETLIDSMKRGPAGLKGRRITFETEWSEPLAVEGGDDEEPEAPADPSQDADREKTAEKEGHDGARQSGSITWRWEAGEPGPEPEEVLSMLDSCLHSLKEIAPPLPATCEICNQSPVNRLTLRDGTPGYYCEGCQEKLIGEYKKKVRDYEELPCDHARGLAHGIVGAVATALALGYVASLVLPKFSDTVSFWVVLLGSGLVAAPVFSAAQAGMGRVDDKGVNIIVAMCILGMFATHACYYVFRAWKITGWPFSLLLVYPALSLFLSSFWIHIVALVAGSFLALYAAVSGLKRTFPSPDVTFEELKTYGSESEGQSN